MNESSDGEDELGLTSVSRLPVAGVRHLCGVLQSHRPSVFHQRAEGPRGAGGGGPGSHGQLCKWHV